MSETKNKILLRPGKTSCARSFTNDFSLVLAGILILIAWLTPWEIFYTWGWYKSFIDLMSAVSPNIREVAQSESEFIEYVQAYLACANLLGPLYLIAAFRCGLVHGKSDEVLVENRHAKLADAIKLLLVATSFLALMLLGALKFDGQTGFYNSDIFFRSQLAFITVHIMIWWIAGGTLIGMIALSMLVNKLLHNKY